jgi:hypothetical protein
LLPASAQPELRDLFRRYLDSRLAVFQKIPDLAAVREELAKNGELQTQIWTRAMAACQSAPAVVVAQVVPALNAMFDVAASRNASAQLHPPGIIFVMLGVLALICSLLAGHAMAGGKSRSWIHMIGFSFVLATTVYVILDLEFPRLGIIRIDTFDQVLLELRQSVK